VGRGVFGSYIYFHHTIATQLNIALLRREPSDRRIMEEDRAQVDLGVAVDTEEILEEPVVPRQPKKRFVGRRQAAEAASKNGPTSIEESGTIQGLTSASKRLLKGTNI
jgi:hypothetical protein